jgi:hypothetical protein
MSCHQAKIIKREPRKKRKSKAQMKNMEIFFMRKASSSA